MISVYDRVISTIPVLEIVLTERQGEALPTVVFYHGWTNVKEQSLIHGYEIAKKGFRVLLPEAIYHGQRQDDKLTKEHMMDFWEIIQQNITEFPIITDYYIKAKLSDPERLGVTGASMGGITTCGLLTTYPAIKAGVCLMGSPNLTAFAQGTVAAIEAAGTVLPADTPSQLAKLKKYDLSLNPGNLAGRPIHFWHGEEDPVVPYLETFAFYEKFKGTEAGRNLSFTRTADGHRVPYQISLETATFFGEHL